MAYFSDIFLDVTKNGHKIHKENYLPYGAYPIIDQGQEYIAGYANESEGLYEDVPAIIFGDHTRIIKYVDVPCFLGADGVKLLKAKDSNSNYKYLYYALCYAKIPDTGYNRHFKWLKEVEIRLPPQNEQQNIVAVLDKLGTLISLRKQQLAKLDELVKAQFVEMFGTFSHIVKAGTFMYEMRNGLSPSNTGEYPAKVLTLSAVTQGAFDANAWKEGCFDNCPPNDKRICTRDFYMCRGNGNKALVGTGVYSTEDRFDLIFPDTVIAARVDEKIVRLPYLYMAWKMPTVRRQIEENARTTNGTYKINQKVISNIELTVPPLFVQDNFSIFIQQVNEQKLTIQQSLDKLVVLKKSLMQEYFG